MLRTGKGRAPDWGLRDAQMGDAEPCSVRLVREMKCGGIELDGYGYGRNAYYAGSGR